jgi:type IV pilus assembly protein PilB
VKCLVVKHFLQTLVNLVGLDSMPVSLASVHGQTSNIVDYIVTTAIKNRASDIHIEPLHDKLNIRFRIDGVMYPVENFDTFSKEEIITRIKVLSGLDIAEHRFPQDGHFEFTATEKVFNFRVSILPTIYGEAIVLRIFNRSDIFIKLTDLGFEPDQLTLIEQFLQSPSGMFLTTGPTGSGKTTLLYSILSSLDKQTKNIITLEDPIEFQMDGIRQTQINEGIGLTFAKVLRSVVRQDPDVVMIGEIRDTDTAQMAIQAALTGILVLSTFHTFDVAALVTRLTEIGFSGSVIAQAIRGVVSTRLMRKLCPVCKVSTVNKDGQTIYEPKGCEKCQNKGYMGRIGIFEVVYFDLDLRNAIIEKQPASVITDLLYKKNVKNLKDIAMLKVAKGDTSMEEVLRVAGSLT